MTSFRALEGGVLRLCAAANLAPANREQLRDRVRGGLNWDCLQDLANRHRLRGLLHRHLLVHAGDLLPTDVQATFANSARSVAAINLGLARDLLRILRLLGEHGLKAVPFKGPVLAQQLYGDPAIRCMGDLDLLLRPEDILRAADLLRADGFRLEAKLEPRMQSTFFAEECELNLDHARSGLHVELHWDFLPRYYGFPLLSTGVWERLGSLRLGGQEVPNLGAEDLLLMLCAHGAKHVWSDLSLIADVAELLRSTPIDWDELFERARRLNCERVLFLGLRLATGVLDAPLPEQVTAMIAREGALPGLVRHVEHRLDSSHVVPTGSDAMTARLFQLRLQETAGARLRFVAGLSRLAVLHRLGHFVPPRGRPPAALADSRAPQA